MRILRFVFRVVLNTCGIMAVMVVVMNVMGIQYTTAQMVVPFLFALLLGLIVEVEYMQWILNLLFNEVDGCD